MFADPVFTILLMILIIIIIISFPPPPTHLPHEKNQNLFANAPPPPPLLLHWQWPYAKILKSSSSSLSSRSRKRKNIIVKRCFRCRYCTLNAVCYVLEPVHGIAFAVQLLFILFFPCLCTTAAAVSYSLSVHSAQRV